MYDPGTHRFNSQDPLGLGPDSNSYRYTDNGPLDATDPTGLAESLDLTPIQMWLQSSAKNYQARQLLTPEEQRNLSKYMSHPEGNGAAALEVLHSQLADVYNFTTEQRAQYMREFLAANNERWARQLAVHNAIASGIATIGGYIQNGVDELNRQAEASRAADTARARQAFQYKKDREDWEKEAARQKEEMDRKADDRISELQRSYPTIRIPWLDSTGKQIGSILTKGEPPNPAVKKELERLQAIQQMGPGEKLGAAVQKMIDKGMLQGELLERAKAFASVENAAVMGTLFAGWGLSHACGIGFGFDAAMGVVGYAMLGMTAIDITKDLFFFAATALNARSDADLERAAEHLKKPVATVTEQLLMAGGGAIIGRGAKSVGKALEELKGAPKPTATPGGSIVPKTEYMPSAEARKRRPNIPNVPAVADVNKATKILTQYERLAEKFGIRLTPARIAELNRLRDAGKISTSDLPAGLLREFPGNLAGKSLEEIKNLKR